MKTLIKLIIAIFISISFFACQKNEVVTNLKPTPSYFISSNYSIQTLIKDTEDDSNQTMNNQLYYLALATCDRILTSGAYLNAVYENVDTNTNEVRFSAAIEQENGIETEFDDFLTQFFANGGNVYYEDIVDSMVYAGDEYVPVFYIPNYSTANFNLTPIVLIGEEANLEWDLPNDTTGDDYAAGWEFDEYMSPEIILVNESMAMSSEAPILIITNGEETEPSIILEYMNQNNLKDYYIQLSSTFYMFKLKSFKINSGYAYEKHGKAEVHSVYYLLNSSGVEYGGVYNRDGFNMGVALLKYKAKLSDIATSKTFTYPTPLVTPFWASDVPAIYNNILCYSYEYDYFASKKRLAACLGFDKACYKAKYTNEKWQHNCDTKDISDFPDVNDYWVMSNNYKGSFVLYRFD